MKKNGKRVICPIVEKINKFVENEYVSKSEFANVIGFDTGKWNKISNGVQNLTINDIAIIAQKTGIPLVNLIDYPNEYVPKTKNATPEYDRVSVVFEVSRDNREQLIKLITQKN